MTLAANTSITLGVSKPKKDAVVVVGAPTVGAGDMAIWVGSGINQRLLQGVVGELTDVFDYMMTNLKNSPANMSKDYGAPESTIAVAAGGAGKVAVYMGADITGGQKSHFAQRTFKRLIERLLEAGKTGDVAGVVAGASINRVGASGFQFGGDEWTSSHTVNVSLSITDPDGQTEDDSFSWSPPAGMTAVQVAMALYTYVDSLVHYSVHVSSDTIEILPSASENTISVSMTLVS